MRIRIVGTASGKKALQVVSKSRGKLTVHKHIGTFSDKAGKADLYSKAQEYILEQSKQRGLFDKMNFLDPANIIITQSKPLFAYRFFENIYNKLGFGNCNDKVIKDLVIARIFAPVSKRETKDVLEDFFDRRYSLLTIYRHLKRAIKEGVKETFQTGLINFVKGNLNDGLRLIFYDVTTLYFDSQIRTELKDFGFSKDHRPSDTQVVVGLVVNKDGFPLYFDVFKGNTFEGHTFLPVIKRIRKLLNSPNLVVVADAAMISTANIAELNKNGLEFIVGARLANLPQNLIEFISEKINKKDGKIVSVAYKEQRLICQYLTSRANKDRSDRLKQILKAENAMKRPSEIANRFRFLKKDANKKYDLNTDLIIKAEKLEGIKGYVTNTNLDPQVIIARYHDLWKIENAFRITKSDLEARPVFHRLDETIKAHLVIVFAGLAITKYVEIKTEMSIKKVLKIISKVLTHKVKITTSGQTAYIETTIEEPTLREKIDKINSLGH